MSYTKTRLCEKCGSTRFYKSYGSYFNSKSNKLCKKCSSNLIAEKLRSGDASPLLDESLNSYYWLGFILADGHIENGRLSLMLSIKDESHLKRLAKVFHINLEKNPLQIKMAKERFYCGLSIMHKSVMNTICDKYDIKSNKTMFPPNISNIGGDELTALSIGFIDGDGYISKQTGRDDYKISIKTHRSWEKNLKAMFGKSYINNYGYAVSNICDIKSILKLKKFILKHNLPALNRKWDKIDADYKTRTEMRIERTDKIKTLFADGYTRREISKELCMNYATVKGIINRNKFNNDKK